MLSKFFLAFDIGGTYFRYGIVTDTGIILYHNRLLTKTVFSQPYEKFLSSLVEECVHYAGAGTIAAAVVGVPCTIDVARRRLLSCPNVQSLQGEPFVKKLESILCAPVLVERDVNLALLGEHWMGSARGYSTVAGVFVGTGLGCSLIINNRLFTGAHGVAAELGHIKIPGQSDPCACGDYGCLELYAAGIALGRAIESFSEGKVSYEEAVVKATRGEEPWNMVARQIKEMLAWGVGTLITLIDPELVVLGGGVIDSNLFSIEELSQTIKKYVRKPEPANSIAIKLASLGDKAGLIGAAKFALERIR
ncbi:MAG: ROK family protein [Candidatus Bathyarchaeia archaeon]